MRSRKSSERCVRAGWSTKRSVASTPALSWACVAQQMKQVERHRNPARRLTAKRSSRASALVWRVSSVASKADPFIADQDVGRFIRSAISAASRSTCERSARSAMKVSVARQMQSQRFAKAVGRACDLGVQYWPSCFEHLRTDEPGLAFAEQTPEWKSDGNTPRTVTKQRPAKIDSFVESIGSTSARGAST